ncbi:uncharacterized protein LOC135684176 isoform X2 [Rhopilema esculentum]|uniref:uncharacterized protein LOC135684176 isoform X2 n=1 Tax=Rhopilema esculentum TaxID=499914 RepID=UPI0031CEA489
MLLFVSRNLHLFQLSMAMRVAIMFAQALLLMLQCHIVASREFHVTNAYYIRHYNGRCLEYDGIRQVLFYGRVCREKFEWQEGARLIHIPTKKCVSVNSTSDGTFLSLTSQCSGTSSLFQYDHNNRVISHRSSNKCLHPADEGADPIANTGVVLKTGCDKNTNKYYFRETVYFIIRHIGGLCWVYDLNHSIVRLSNKVACDRFEYVNDKLLRHVETGKCVIFSSSYIRLTDDCRSAQPMYGDEHSLLHYGVSQCVQPASVALSPPVNNELVLLNSCINEDRLRFYFYDDKDVLKVKVISESCDDMPASSTCQASKGHVIVNGRQYSPSTRGINVVIFDYRSGLFEHSKAYDVLGFSGPRDDLANFLNSLTAGKILFLTVKDAANLNANLALALQKVGVSATFATTPVPKTRSSLAYIGYTGQQRKSWEKSLNRLGGGGGSTIEVVINSFVDRNGINDCSNELGVRTRKIPDSRFYARTTWINDLYHRPFQARLHLNTNGWCSQGNVPVSDYLQVDIGITKLISGIAIQGHGIVFDHGITKFKIEYSENGENWQFYKTDQNLVEEFLGVRKVDMLETRVNWFRNMKTRFIRVVPTARISAIGVNCMRIELYGCSITRSFLSVQWPSRSQQINDNYKGSINTFGTIKENLTVGISIAANNNSLATNIEQVHFKRVNASTTLDNGTLVKNSGEVNASTDQKRKIDSATFTEFHIKEENYYSFTVDFTGKILDAELPTGDRRYVITLESRYGILAYAEPLTIKRLQPDRSILQFNVTNENLQQFVENSYLHLNLSVSHLAVASHSNAYAFPDIEPSAFAPLGIKQLSTRVPVCT